MDKKKILITGGGGLVGTAIKQLIAKTPEDYQNYDFYFNERNINGLFKYDLIEIDDTFSLFNEVNPDYVFHLAAKVGGVQANKKYIGDFYDQNIKINTNVLEAAKCYKVKRVISLLSTCIYPDSATYPLTEDQIHNGPPHDSNYGYAHAKRALDIQSRAYNEQHGCDFVTIVPNNLYGEQDNYHLEDSHVIPAIIRKIYEAKLNNIPSVTLWGDGTPLREFTYAGDIAKILFFLLGKSVVSSPLNVGKSAEYNIKDIANIISSLLNYKGQIIWDTSKPSGQFRKPSDNSKFLSHGWKEKDYTSLHDGLKKTCEYFVSKYPKVRGI